MADYAPNFTARHKITYVFEGDVHECTTRWPSANTQLENVDAANVFWTAFLSATASLRHTSWQVLNADYAPADSNVFLPVPFPGEVAAGEVVAAAGASTRIAHSIWSGRSVLGSKMRFQVFGLYWTTLEATEVRDFYLLPGEFPVVLSGQILLQGAGMVGPDDEAIAVVRARVAYKQNDAWVNKKRRGT
jgi:hypothetical protein